MPPGFFNKIPFVKLLLPFAVGIYFYLFDILFIPFYFFILPVVLFVLGKQKQFRKLNVIQGFAIHLFLFIAGNYLSYLNHEIKYENHFSKIAKNKQGLFWGYVAETPVQKGKSIRVVFEVDQYHYKKNIENVKGKILCYFQKTELAQQIDYGDYLFIPADFSELTPPANPNQFSAKDFFKYQNIFHASFLKNDLFILEKSQSHFNFKKLALHTRSFFIHQIFSMPLSDEAKTIIAALVLGYDDEIDKEVILDFAETGVMHILSVSGLHIGVVFLILQNLLVFLNKDRKKQYLKLFILISFLWFYAYLTGFSTSVVRAALMFSLISLGTTFKLNNNIFNILAFSAFMLLVFNPGYLVNVGFQLSYSALAGILLIQPLFDKIWQPENKVVYFLYSTATVSTAATLGTLPLNLYYYHQFPLYFIPSNILAIPLSTVCIYLGFLLLIFLPFDFIVLFLSKLTNLVIRILNYSLSEMAAWPYSNIQPITFSKAEILFLYIAIIFTLVFIYFPRAKLIKAGLLCFIVYFIYSIYNVFPKVKQTMLVVYQIPGTTAIEIKQQHTSFFISDKSLCYDRWMQKFHCQPFRSEQNIKYTEFIPLNNNLKPQKIYSKNFISNDKFFQYNDKLFAVFDNSDLKVFLIGKNIKTDYILLQGEFNFFDVRKLYNQYIILDNTFKIRGKTKLLALLKKQNKMVWDIKKDGAFVKAG